MPNNEEKHKEIEESVILKGYGLFSFWGFGYSIIIGKELLNNDWTVKDGTI